MHLEEFVGVVWEEGDIGRVVLGALGGNRRGRAGAWVAASVLSAVTRALSPQLRVAVGV
jgi:hypothetical protein